MSFKDYLREIEEIETGETGLSSKIYDIDNIDVEHIRNMIEAPYVKVELSTLGVMNS